MRETEAWRRVPIVDLCETHVDCVNRTAPVVPGPTEFKMIRTTNVKRGYIDTADVRYVDEATYRRWTRRLVPRLNDVILTREAPLGEAGKVRTSEALLLGQRLYHFRPDPKRLDPDFLLYSLMGPGLQSQIKALGSGSTVEHMRLSDIPSLALVAPKIEEQRRIASILSAYDDLIENCQRRIRILEDLARGLYREWFVHFRFPGAGSLPRVDSPLGPIPQGCEARGIREVVEINPRVTVPREGEKPFVPMGCLSNDSMLVTDIELRSGNSGSKFANGDTLFARITPCLENGKTGFVQFLASDQSVAFGSTEFIVFRGKAVPPEFVYLLARTDDLRGHAIKSMTGASGRQRVQESCFDAYRVVVPPQDVLAGFAQFVRPMFRSVQQLHEKTVNLRRTRDLLLPRLMSGQIDLRNAGDTLLA